MREIKFRAWDLKKQDWYKPIYEAYNGNLHDISITLNGIVMERTLEFSASILNSDNYILSQFTGLADKNGGEVFEGDVINIHEAKRNYVVKFHKGCFKLFHCDQKLNDMLWGTVERVSELLWNFEIIGNIYQNPELLK